MHHKHIVLSVVIPVYNSESTLRELKERLDKVLHHLVGADRFEIVFINDGSKDSSWALLKEMAICNSHVIAINLMRNFGQHNAIMCGLSNAKGEYVVTMDDDLQNPPEEIPKLFDEINIGCDVVYGIYQEKNHPFFRNIGSECVQFIYRKTFNAKTKLTAFRIMRGELVSRILSYEKSFTFIDGLISWYTTRIGAVTVRHDSRKIGKSGYSIKMLLILALNLMTNFCIAPLQVATATGLLFALFGFVFGAFFVIKKAFWGIPVSGFTSLIVTVTVFSGVQLLTVGMLGEYIGRIHINVNNRPQYAIRELINATSLHDGESQPTQKDQNIL